MDESSLGIHQVELVVQSSPGLGDGGGVAQHADSSLHLGQVTSGNDSRRLVVDSHLESSGTPVDELDCPLGLDGGDRGVDILRDDITSVQQTASHVLSVSGVALHHLVGGLKASVGDLGDCQLLVVCLLGRDDRSIGGQGEVDSRVWHQVGLELSQVDVQGTVESERCGD